MWMPVFCCLSYFGVHTQLKANFFLTARFASRGMIKTSLIVFTVLVLHWGCYPLVCHIHSHVCIRIQNTNVQPWIWHNHMQAGKAMRAVTARVKAAQAGSERTWADQKNLARFLKPGGSYVARTPPSSEGRRASGLLMGLWNQKSITRVLWRYSK